MRKANAVIAALILVLFIIHGLLGAFQLTGAGAAPSVMRGLSYVMMLLLFLHAAIGIKYTADSVRVARKTGAPYFRENRLFWARRLSGFAIFLFLGLHVTAFSYSAEGALRLHAFDGFRLAAQLLLLISVAVHVITNVRPALISFGIRKLKPRAADILFVLSVLLIIMGCSFLIYFFRWNAA